MIRESEQLDFGSLLFPGRKVLTVSEIAAKLELSERHILDLIDEGKLRAMDFGGQHEGGRKRVRIPVEFYEEFLRGRVI